MIVNLRLRASLHYVNYVTDKNTLNVLWSFKSSLQGVAHNSQLLSCFPPYIFDYTQPLLAIVYCVMTVGTGALAGLSLGQGLAEIRES